MAGGESTGGGGRMGGVKEVKSGLVVALPRDGTGGECMQKEEAPTFEHPGKEKKDHSSQRRENHMG